MKGELCQKGEIKGRFRFFVEFPQQSKKGAHRAAARPPPLARQNDRGENQRSASLISASGSVGLGVQKTSLRRDAGIERGNRTRLATHAFFLRLSFAALPAVTCLGNSFGKRPLLHGTSLGLFADPDPTWK